MKRRASGPAAPQAAISSARLARSAVAISGGAKAGMAPSSPLVQSRRHKPGAVRPARPRR